MQEQIVKLKDGQYATVLWEFHTDDQPGLKILDENGERVFGWFLDVELPAILKNFKSEYGPLPMDSDFMKITMKVNKNSVEYINEL